MTPLPSAPRPPRTVLFLPASNPRAIEKARGLDCDAVVLDLEDAVGPERKAEARAAMAETVGAGGFAPRRLVVRVNGLDTQWGAEDLAAAAAAGPDAVLIPKADGPAAVRAADAALAGAPAHTGLWAMVETCAGVLAAAAMAATAAETRLAALVAGVNDLAKDMGCSPGPDRAPLLPALAAVVTAARAHGLIAIDGVFNAIDDAEGFAAEAAQGRRWGFHGKSLIHPGQVAAAKAAFGPTEAERAWARAVVAAFADPANAGKGVLKVGGGMVERLHLAEAEALLAEG